MRNAAIIDKAYQTLPLTRIHESHTNPRRTFEESKLLELAESIRTHGLIQPITVRPNSEGFEIVAGARRYRASQIAELAEIPVRILTLTDAQALEVQIIENSQRQDVHPYEEAAGYERLLSLPGYDVPTLAEKCGKSDSHIYARLALLQLIPDVAEAFQQDRITASHANLIARLPKDSQPEAFEQCFRKDWQDKEGHLLPAKYLAAWLNRNIYLNLAEAPFSSVDASLLPDAGACLDCPKRSGYNTRLFADVTADVCLDADCYQRKVGALIQITIAKEPNITTVETEWRKPDEVHPGSLSRHEFAKANAPGTKKKKKEETPDEETTASTCASARPALVTYGDDKGRVIHICSDRTCPVHFPQSIESPEDEAERAEAAQQRDAARQAQERQVKKRETMFRRILANIPATLSPTQLRLTLRALVASDEYGLFDATAEHFASHDENDARESMDVLTDAAAQASNDELSTMLVRIALSSHVRRVEVGATDYLTEAAALFVHSKMDKTATQPKRKATKATTPTKGRKKAA